MESKYLMAIILGYLYTSLLEAGVSPERANLAAQEVLSLNTSGSSGSSPDRELPLLFVVVNLVLGIIKIFVWICFAAMLISGHIEFK